MPPEISHLDLTARHDDDLLDELSEFRGRTLYDDGRRPAFRSACGKYQDMQEYDLHAHHLVLRNPSDQSLIGCLRLSPCERFAEGQVESTFGTESSANLLRQAGLSRSDVLEGGRLTVASAYQGCGYGPMLLLAAGRLARSIGRRLLWGVAGTADGQADAFARCGYDLVPGFETASHRYDDQLKLVKLDIERCTQ